MDFVDKCTSIHVKYTNMIITRKLGIHIKIEVFLGIRETLRRN